MRPLLNCDTLDTTLSGIEDLGKQSLQHPNMQHDLNVDPQHDADLLRTDIVNHITSGGCEAAKRWAPVCAHQSKILGPNTKTKAPDAWAYSCRNITVGHFQIESRIIWQISCIMSWAISFNLVYLYWAVLVYCVLRYQFRSCVQWSSSPWIDFATMDHRAVNLTDFEPVFILDLVFAPTDDTYTTEFYFVAFLQHGKTCACRPKNELRELPWVTLYGRCVTRISHANGGESIHLWQILSRLSPSFVLEDDKINGGTTRIHF